MRTAPKENNTLLDIYTDSDWAGCKRTRRSTTGGCALFNGCLVKSWSTTQALIALSSGEAELYGVVRASAEGLGLQSLLKDLGVEADVRVLADASAALGVVQRRGIGKLRHVHTNFLWVQEASASKVIDYRKEKGADNCADLMTKYVTKELVDRFCERLGTELKESQNDEAYKIGCLERVQRDYEEAKRWNSDLRIWTRQDLSSVCLRGSMRQGPRMGGVLLRRTYGTSDGVLIVEDKPGEEGFWKHRYWKDPTDITTVLYYEVDEKEDKRRSSSKVKFEE